MDFVKSQLKAHSWSNDIIPISCVINNKRFRMCQENLGKADQKAGNKFVIKECLEEPQHIKLNRDPAYKGIGVTSGYIGCKDGPREKPKKHESTHLR